MKISKKYLFVFVAAIIVGLITHFMNVGYPFPNGDELILTPNAVTGGWELSLGRWLIGTVDKLDTYVILPWVAFLQCIILLAVITVLLCIIFEIENKYMQIFAAMAVIVTPLLSEVFAFHYASSWYMMSYLLSILFVYFNSKEKLYYSGIASLLLTISLGLYQAYLGMAIVVTILYLIFIILKRNMQIKEFLKIAARYIITAIIGFILYFIIWKIVLSVKGVEMNDYKGIGNWENYSLVNLLLNTVAAYKKSFNFMFTNKIIYNIPLKIFANVVMVAAMLFTAYKKALKNKLSKLNIAVISVLFAILPIGLAFIDILSPESVNTSPLTVVQFTMIMFFTVVLLQDIKIVSKKSLYLKGFIMVMISVIVFNNWLIANIIYRNIELQFYKSYSFAGRILQKLEEYEEYDVNTPIIVAGSMHAEDSYIKTTIWDMQSKYLKEMGLSTLNLNLYDSPDSWRKMIEVYHGVNLQFMWPTERMDIIESDEYKNMPNFPKAGCVKKIDDVLVVKISNQNVF